MRVFVTKTIDRGTYTERNAVVSELGHSTGEVQSRTERNTPISPQSGDLTTSPAVRT